MPKQARWLDLIALTVSIVVIALCFGWIIQSGVFTTSLTADQTLSWHLVRAAGITSYLLLTASTIWGLIVSGGFIRNWSPGALSTSLHNTASVVSLVLGLVHALLLLLDKYYSYTLASIFVPFAGPYRPEAVGLGVLGFWLIVVVSVSFPLKRYIGYKAWKNLHLTSYLAFGLVTLHGLFAGTDASLLGFRIVLVGSMAAVVALLAVRVLRDGKPTERAVPATRR
jgi:predicted ferric reductase